MSAFDNGGGQGNASGATTITQSVTVAANSNPSILVSVSSYGGGPAPSGVTGTFDGVALNVLSDETGVASRPIRFLALGGIPTGTHDLVLNWTGNDYFYITYQVFYNTDTTTPFGTPVADTGGGSGGTSSTLNVTTAAGDEVAGYLLTNDLVTTLAPGGGATEVIELNSDASGATRFAISASHHAATGTTETVTFSWTEFTVYGSWGIRVNSAAGGGSISVAAVMHHRRQQGMS